MAQQRGNSHDDLRIQRLQTRSKEAAEALQTLKEAWEEGKADLLGDEAQKLTEVSLRRQSSVRNGDVDKAWEASHPQDRPSQSHPASRPTLVTPISKRQKLSQEGFS